MQQSNTFRSASHSFCPTRRLPLGRRTSSILKYFSTNPFPARNLDAHLPNTYSYTYTYIYIRAKKTIVFFPRAVRAHALRANHSVYTYSNAFDPLRTCIRCTPSGRHGCTGALSRVCCAFVSCIYIYIYVCIYVYSCRKEASRIRTRARERPRRNVPDRATGRRAVCRKIRVPT